MNNFEYYTPTKIFFGTDTEKNVGGIIKDYGFKKVLVHYGMGSVKKSGLLDLVFESLKANDIDYIELGGAVPNPLVDLCRTGVQMCQTNNVDFILAVGGGSAIDSAKAIAMATKNNIDPWDIYSRKFAPTTALPVGTILTLAATGSEMSNSSVISNGEGNLKRGYNHDCTRPLFSIINPVYTYTLPPYQTASGAVDIIMHTLERYFTPVDNCELTDHIARGVIQTTMHNAPIALNDPTNYNARAELLWASTLSHNGLTSVGRMLDFSVHQLEHELGGAFDVTHGAGLSALWGSYARYVYTHNIDRFAFFATDVMGVQGTTPTETALLGIQALEDFFTSINMPITMTQLGITNLTDEQIEELAYKCTFEETRLVGTFKPLNKQDIINIYNMAK